VGTAIGIFSAAINAGQFVTPLIMGSLKDHFPELDHGYYWVTRFAVMLAMASLATSIVIFIWD
jgi:MFS family permease